ncbi:50S ribosomal protein L10 [Candidatus Uhrbacteria bacterium]|nr:50S ribosomal protein L10 [Candidatus Uhrbacteria bacterium]
MPKTRQQKVDIVGRMKEKIARSKAMVFTSVAAFTIKDADGLREKGRALQVESSVTKKNLLLIALKEAGYMLDEQTLPGSILHQDRRWNPGRPFRGREVRQTARHASVTRTAAWPISRCDQRSSLRIRPSARGQPACARGRPQQCRRSKRKGRVTYPLLFSPLQGRTCSHKSVLP